MLFTHRVDVDCSPQEAIRFISDFENLPLWNPNVIAVHKLTEGPVGAGSQFRQRRSSLGREVEERFVVTRLEPGRGVAIKSTEAAMPFAFSWLAEEHDRGSATITNHVRLDPPGALAPIEQLVARQVRTGVAHNLELLAARLRQAGRRASP